MKIHVLSKIGAAVVCALSLSAHGANLISADSMVGFSGDNINQMLGLKSADTLRSSHTVSLGNGLTKVRFQQYHQGIKVFGRSVAATRSDMGFLSDVSGQFLELGLLSTKGKISAEQALTTFIGSKDAVKAATTYNHQHEQVIYQHDGQPVLANLVSYVLPGSDGSNEPIRPTAFIDANTGVVLFEYDNLQHVSGTGPGGNEKTGQYHFGTDFAALDVTQTGTECALSNDNVAVIDMAHGTSGGAIHTFTCPENSYKAINGGYSPLNDALYFGNVLYNMYNTYVGTAPLSFKLTMRVHYANNYENAFWDGSSMTFGDGGSNFYPLVSADFIGHEVSHGFTEQNAAFVFSGMPGSLSESFSDMAGETAEYYMKGSNDWLVGGDIFKAANGALRYMNNPPLDGRSVDHASQYDPANDTRVNSGIFNKAFYLLATTSGWNTRMAFEIMALANQVYWTAVSTYDEAACGAYKAAGDKGFNQADVTAAFAEVGVVTCDTGPEPDVALSQGVAIEINGSAGSTRYFTYESPADVDTLSFTMSGGTGDTDMYVKYGSKPTVSTYDCAFPREGNDAQCNIGSHNAKVGTYYVMSRAYSDYANVTLVADHTVTPPPIGDSGSETNINIARRDWSRYTVEVAEGASELTVNISGGTGDADLYLRHDAAPTTRSYDCRPYLSGNQEFCTIEAPASGEWHIGIRGYSAVADLTMDWVYQ